MQRTLWPWMIPLLLAVLLLVMTQINRDIYWYDEEQSLFIVGGGEYDPVDVGTFFARVADNARPPLYPVLLLAHGNLLGWSEFSTRVLSTFFGLIALALTYRLGADLKSPRLGLIAAILLGTSTLYLHYWHDVRDYTLYVLLTGLSGWLYWRFQQRRWRASRGEKIVFVLALTGLFYVHYVAPVTYAALGAYHVLFAKRNARWNGILFLFFVPLLLFAFWLPVTIIAATLQSGVSRSLPIVDILWWSLIGYGNGIGPLIMIALGIAALRLRGREIGFVVVWLIVALIAALVLNAFGDFLFHVRHMIGLIVPFVLLIALLIDDTLQKTSYIAGVALLAVWIGLGVFFSTGEDFMLALPGQERDLPMAPMQAAFEVIDQYAAADDAAIFYVSTKGQERVNDRVLYYYLHNRLDHFAQVQSMWDLSDITVTPDVSVPYDERFAVLTESADRVWYFQLDSLDPAPQAAVQFMLSEKYELCGTSSSDGINSAWYRVSCPVTTGACVNNAE